MKIIRRNIPTSQIANISARLPNQHHDSSNYMDNKSMKLIDHNMITHIEPYFNTFVTTRGKGRPNIIADYKNILVNYVIQQESIITSYRLPMILTLSASPIMIPQEKY